MSFHHNTAAAAPPEKDFSFLESLSLEPNETFSLAYPEKPNSLPFPSTQSNGRRSPPEVNHNIRRSPSKARIPLSSTRETSKPAIPRAPPVSFNPAPVRAAAVPKSTTPSAARIQPKPSKANMSITPKAQAQCVELCHKSTAFGNRIATHFLEYLTTASRPPLAFQSLANDFLDTLAILATIEAGLKDNTQRLPAEMVSELENKFRVTIADFQALDHVVNKLLDIELGTKSRLKRGWGKMFGDNDLAKHKIALSRTRDSLKLSAMVFEMSLDGNKVKKEMGIGFTGLAAALDRLDEFEKKALINTSAVTQNTTERTIKVDDLVPTLPSVDVGQQYQYQRRESPQQPLINSHAQAMPPVHAQSTSQMHWPGRSTSSHPESPYRPPVSSTNGDFQPLPPDYRQYHAPTFHALSSMGSEHQRPWSSDRPDSYEPGRHMPNIVDDSQSHAGTIESDSLLNEVDGVEVDPKKVVRFTAEPASMPRWTPRSQMGPESGNMRAALISAIRSRNHQLVEQMLDRGVPANTGPDMPALKEAILAHDVESVRLLLTFGADPNDPDRNGVTPLFAAVERSFLVGATTLLKYGADPNLAAGPDLESPLGLATSSNLVGFTHLLLIYGGDVNHMLSSGNTVLIGAIKKKTPKKFIELLLTYGAKPNSKSREGKTALFEAIQLGRADIVKSLLDHGADPNLPGPKHMLWPSTYQAPCLKLLLDAGADPKKCPGIMELATSLNNIESVRILLKAGVNPNAKKDGVYTPLCTSIRDDRADIFDLLLSNKADPNTPASEYPAFKCLTHDRVHFLPALVAAGADLHSPKGIVETAVKFNNMEGLNWLLDQGLNPNDKNPKGHSPLTTAIAEGHIEMVDLLLHRGASPNMRGQDWPVCLAVKNPPILSRILAQLSEPRAFKGVMEMAVSANQLESVKLLIEAGVSVEDKNGGVFSPLTTALRENHRHIVRYLLTDAGADVNSPGEHLPVVKALRRFRGEDTEMLELLLDHGADPNLVYRGWNGMMQAVENGDEDVLRLIVKRCPVDLQVVDELGRNVVKIAESRGWNEAVDIILSNGK